ncbi:MBL fold metallo-hydrolase [Pseudonocardia acaciae]|uniref:MBL fold metallo-hydrolase n=1 Tax=Pseudonocardia acaciae TaxID=551276 RepID=UPI001FE13A99|nr:MBL fold metallo-hydrolase [Pseudonocardia acaciae]
MTDTDERLRRPATLRSLSLGEMKVTYLPDGVVPLAPRGWLPETSDAVWADHPEYLDESGYLVASIGGLLVQAGDRAMLIDAGFGPGSLPPEPGDPRGTVQGGALLDGLAAVGCPPERIEAVAFTHLHVDHIGWAPRGVFPEADHLVAEPEWSGRSHIVAHGTTEEMLAALAPRVRTVRDGEEIFPGVRVLFTPGHTVGHTGYVISSGGQRLVAFGDALHSPIQVDHPQWRAASDHDAGLSGASRRRVVAELERPDTIGYGVHFADVVFGRVRRDGDGPGWRPLP